MGARACAHRNIYKVKYKMFYGRARMRACARASGARGADLHARQKKTIQSIHPKQTFSDEKKIQSNSDFFEIHLVKKTCALKREHAFFQT